MIVGAEDHVVPLGQYAKPEDAARLGDFKVLSEQAAIPSGERVVIPRPGGKAATGVERVYYLALMERAAHLHLWLVTKKDEGELRGVAYVAQQPPLTASLSDAEAMSRKIRAEFEAS